MSTRAPARGTTPSAPGGARRAPLGPRRIREQAWDGLSAAAVSLGGSVAVTLALGLLLRWLG